MMSTRLSLALLIACIWETGLCKEKMAVIVKEEDFYDFSLTVNSGRDYSGTTVYLYSDLDFANYSKKFVTVGFYKTQYDRPCFRGIFDGQGHTISNLKMNISASMVGVFGNTEDATIKNIVLDSSCSVNSFYNNQLSNYVGSIIGACFGSKGNCMIENIVNMASVTFSGYAGDSGLYMGGIAGYLFSSDNYTSVKNCLNYGDITFSGLSDNWEYIGGLIGQCSDKRSEKGCNISNSVNYGTIKYSITPLSRPSIGGLVGSGYNTSFDNCLSAGRILVDTFNERIGSIIGIASGVDLAARIVHSFWTKDLWMNNSHGSGSSKLNVVGSYLIDEFTEKFLDELNSRAWNNDGWSKWIKLHPNGGTIGGIAREIFVAILNKFVGPTRRGHTFDSWCKDMNLHKKYDPGVDNIASITDLYAKYKPKSYIVTFEPAGGFTSMLYKSVTYKQQYGKLPVAMRDGYTFEGWFTGLYGTLDKITADSIVNIASNHKLYPYYKPKEFTVKFDPSEGVMSVKSKTVKYKQQYGELPETTRTGHSFGGWFTRKNGNGDLITPDSIVSILKDTTLYAKWAVGIYTLTFDLGNGTKIEDTLKYNEEIKYPNAPRRNGYKFEGWDTNIKTMPGKSITIRAKWKITGPNLATAVVGIVGAVVEIVFIVLVVIMAFVLSKAFLVKRENTYGGVEMVQPYSPVMDPIHLIIEDDMAGLERISSEDRIWSLEDMLENRESTISEYDDLYPQGYESPEMTAALREAGLDEESIGRAVKACNRAGIHAKQSGKLVNGFTKEDAEAVALYTFDFGPSKYEMNPYRIINKALSGLGEESMERASGLMHIVMRSLRKLPKVTGRTLYRGLRETVGKEAYREGSIVMWPGLSSTTSDKSITKRFLPKEKNGNKGSGTLFVIEDGWGYDIQPYSLFPGEEEILLEPNRYFRVQSVIESETTVVKLQMLDTPVILPQFFGSDPK